MLPLGSVIRCSLDCLPELRQLKLYDNRIQLVKGLIALTNLQSIDLSGNRIEYIEVSRGPPYQTPCISAFFLVVLGLEGLHVTSWRRAREASMRRASRTSSSSQLSGSRTIK